MRDISVTVRINDYTKDHALPGATVCASKTSALAKEHSQREIEHIAGVLFAQCLAWFQRHGTDTE